MMAKRTKPIVNNREENKTMIILFLCRILKYPSPLFCCIVHIVLFVLFYFNAYFFAKIISVQRNAYFFAEKSKDKARVCFLHACARVSQRSGIQYHAQAHLPIQSEHARSKGTEARDAQAEAKALQAGSNPDASEMLSCTRKSQKHKPKTGKQEASTKQVGHNAKDRWDKE